MGYSKRGRTARADLTEDAVRNIRAKSAIGVSVRELAQEYDVGFETIRRIVRWETWRWVGEEAPIAKQSREPTEEEIAASKERFLQKVGLAPARIPSQEEALAAAARESDEFAARYEADLRGLEKEGARPDALLAELERKTTDGGGK